MSQNVNHRHFIENEILRRVNKPSQYLGTELNSVHKDLNTVDLRFSLVFPDMYEVGLGNLGLHILYAILNKHTDVWAERSYAPGIDMEAELRKHKIPLFALESKDSLGGFDGLGFTLQSELTYTNILNILDLSNIPLRTADRGEEHPLTFCGGPAVFNPEPLVYFMDFFVFGDGEDVINEIVDVFRQHTTRAARLEALSRVDGIYVPALYPTDVLEDGQILPSQDAPKIVKRIAPDLNAAEFPVDYLVPFTRQIHDRISLEVLRGCTQGCRFCQAGMVTRPVRERSIDNIETLMERTLAATGYEEVSLVSLSTCDYSKVRTMVSKMSEKAREQMVGVSLPSLRLDSFSVELADIVAGVRRTGLTFAPEAASPRLRSVINKWIPDEELLSMSQQAYQLGWDHVKLYFMIGLPTERDDDVDAIADLTLRTLDVGRKINRKAKVNTGVSTFVPKPFTPFQWAAQINRDETKRRQEILFAKLGKHPSVKFGRHNANETFLEGLVSRADRRAGDLIQLAFEKGARFEAWDEHLKMRSWFEAIEELEYDVDFQLRERELDERLPWDHIDVLIPKKWFQEDWQRAVELKHAQDCRHSKCHRCGVIDRERPLCASMLRTSIDGRKVEKDFVVKHAEQKAEEVASTPPDRLRNPAAPPTLKENEVVQRLIFRVAVTGVARFLSHMETTNAWIRTLRRARVPMAYSQGFHPHPKIAFESARPVAEESLGSYMDISVYKKVDPTLVLERLKQVVAPGFKVMSVEEVDLKSTALMAAVTGMDYIMYVPENSDSIQEKLEALLDADEVLVERKKKQRKNKGGRGSRGGRRSSGPVMRQIDMRPNIGSLSLSVPEALRKEDGSTAIAVELHRVGDRGMRPSELLKLLDHEIEACHVLRLRTRFSSAVGQLKASLIPNGNPALDAK